MSKKKNTTDGNGVKLGEQMFGLSAETAFKKEVNEPVEDFVRKQVDDIWRRLDAGEIDLTYACTHVTYNEFKPVYDDDVLITLLLNYGYRIDSVLAFIDRFIAFDAKPIVIMNERKASIYTDIEKLDNVSREKK